MQDEPKLRRVRLRITGRVQGVGYRAGVQEVAVRRGLCGWVRNRSDGSVELEAQGSGDAVESLIAWCRRGPPLATVQAVVIEERPPEPEEGDGFGIRSGG